MAVAGYAMSFALAIFMSPETTHYFVAATAPFIRSDWFAGFLFAYGAVLMAVLFVGGRNARNIFGIVCVLLWGFLGIVTVGASLQVGAITPGGVFEVFLSFGSAVRLMQRARED